ncbi:MAG: type II toxin-antitoxin system YafQ family toxin [Helicobacteraceae bacterium]|nr:type II toxin-antitoxin system YafQ family toxin [Helicobacteraceae bacterium]
MKSEIIYSKAFKKGLKKLRDSDIELTLKVIERLSLGETLEAKYRDHKMQGELKDYRNCHIKPDLVLLYKIQNDRLILVCVAIGSHSELGI